MMIYRTAKLGFHFTVLDPDPDCGAAPVADVVQQGSLYDRDALTRLVKGCEVTTYDIEHCDTTVLAELEAQGHQILPSPRLLQTVQNKVLQKQLFLRHGLPVASFLDQDLADLAPSDFPVVQKLVTGGYDGRGVTILRGPRDRGLEGNTYLEAFVPFTKELGVMVARSSTGENVVYPVVEMLFDPQRHLCSEVLAPANLTPAKPGPGTSRSRWLRPWMASECLASRCFSPLGATFWSTRWHPDRTIPATTRWKPARSASSKITSGQWPDYRWDCRAFSALRRW